MVLIIEVCVDSAESAISAVRAGADRIELCANLGLGGGTTPSMGLLKTVLKVVPKTPIMVMVRPRTGDFLYSDDEFDVMLEDVRLFKNCGVYGVVFGVLTADGRVDVIRSRLLMAEAFPIETCFHRAFDMTRNLEEAYNDVLSIQGVSRILTSGHGKSAPTSLPTGTLQFLCCKSKTLGDEDATKAITILPGCGINPKTVTAVLAALLPFGLREIHLSGGCWEDSAMSFKPEGMGMGVGPGEWGIWRTQEETVRRVRIMSDKALLAFNMYGGLGDSDQRWKPKSET